MRKFLKGDWRDAVNASLWTAFGFLLIGFAGGLLAHDPTSPTPWAAVLAVLGTFLGLYGSWKLPDGKNLSFPDSPQ